MTAAMTQTETVIAAIILDHFGVAITSPAEFLSTRLVDDLKLDSLDLIECAMTIEEAFSIELTHAEFGDSFAESSAFGKSLADLAALVEAKLAAQVMA